MRLAERFGIDVPKQLTQEARVHSHERELYTRACSVFLSWCQEQFEKSDAARQYLESRALSAASIKNFSLGFCPQGPAALKDLLTRGKNQGLLPGNFAEAHLTAQGKHGTYLVFEDRIIFPIFSAQGTICGFGGRTYKPDDTRPKYYNSHEHALFEKGKLLFGLHRAKRPMSESGHAFLVEGYTDCIAMAEAGYPNTVATLGTACTQEQLTLIGRFASTLFVVYDSDRAGMQAIERLAHLCWQTDLDLQIIKLPEKDDPASFFAHGGNFTVLKNQARDIFSFLVEYQSTTFFQLPLAKRVAAIKEIANLLGSIPDPIRRDMLLKQASQAFDIPFQLLNRPLDTALQATQDERSNTPQITQLSQLEKKLIHAILNATVLSADEHQWLNSDFFSLPAQRIISACQQLQRGHAHIEVDTLMKQLVEDDQRIIRHILLDAETATSPDELQFLIAQFLKKQWKKELSDVKLKLDRARSTADTEEISKIIAEIERKKAEMVRRGLV